jgi:hypothetical protein
MFKLEREIKIYYEYLMKLSSNLKKRRSDYLGDYYRRGKYRR